MSTTAIIEEPKFEVLPPDVTTASTELSCPADKVAALYQPFEKPFQAAADLLAKEEAITTAFDARTLRLQMVKARTTITATKDESKSDIKLAANIIDWFHAKGRDRLAAAEARLLDIEKAEERAEAGRLEALRAERAETLDSIGHVSHGVNLAMMTDAEWIEYLQQAKDVYEMKQIRAKREAEAAAAELKRQDAEREAQRIENERIRAEHEAAKAEAKAAAEEAEAFRRQAAEQAAIAEKARVAAENEAKKERDALEAKMKVDLAKRDADARAEREKIEAAAEAERREFLRVQLENSRKQAEAEAEAKALRDAETKRIADEKAAEAAQAKADAAAVKKAAAAPDAAKLKAFAESLYNTFLPEMTSKDGQVIAQELNNRLDALCDWIRGEASAL